MASSHSKPSYQIKKTSTNFSLDAKNSCCRVTLKIPYTIDLDKKEFS